MGFLIRLDTFNKRGLIWILMMSRFVSFNNYLVSTIYLINNFIIHSINYLWFEFQCCELCVVLSRYMLNWILESMEKTMLCAVFIYIFPITESTCKDSFMFWICRYTFYSWRQSQILMKSWSMSFYYYLSSIIYLIDNFIIYTIYDLLLKFQRGELSIILSWNILNWFLKPMEEFKICAICI